MDFLFPLLAIYQSVRKIHLIYNFSWNELNKSVKAAAQKGAICSVRELHRFLGCILDADTNLVPTYLFKVDIENACMRIWILPEEVTSVALLTMK